MSDHDDNCANGKECQANPQTPIRVVAHTNALQGSTSLYQSAGARYGGLVAVVIFSQVGQALA